MIVNCFIQARSNSSRLPGKIMLPIGKEKKPLLIHLWERIGGAADETVVLMPDGDPAIPDLPKDMKVSTGPEHDVAKRFVLALQEFPCDGFVRVCADSPWLHPILIDAAMQLLKTDMPYVLVSGGVPGLQVQGFNSEVFIGIEPNMIGYEREHIGKYWDNVPGFAIDTLDDYRRLKDIDP